MKKLFVLGAMLMVAMSISAYAASVPDNATLDELIEMRTEIEMRIMQHDDFKEVAVPSGSYVIGQHIPAGEYSVTSIAYVVVIVYDDPEKSDMLNMYSIAPDAPVGRLVLADGQAVDINGQAVFAPYAGLEF